MTTKRRRHWLTEHIWRALRSGFILLGMIVWLTQDGFSYTDIVVLCFGLAAAICDQLHGYICKKIEHIMGWTEDFEDYE